MQTEFDQNPVKTTTFNVSSVDLAEAPLREVSYREALNTLLCPCPTHFTRGHPGPGVQSCSKYHGRLVGVPFHPFAAAVHLAFEDHRPLRFSPDMIWLLVAQGVAHHVRENSEEMRYQFVRHEGKVPITVRRDGFVKGSPENPWPEVFTEFSESVRSHMVPGIHELLVPAFSTTGDIERAVSEIVLLDTVQSYFSYGLVTLCGIPSITLEGGAEDWENLLSRVEQLGEVGFDWWTKLLHPIVAQFAAAARGDVDSSFWRSLYKLDDHSGGPYITGWFSAFFPYLQWPDGNLYKNQWWEPGDEEALESLYKPFEELGGKRSGVTVENLPSGLAMAPFTWNFFGDECPMQFVGGFVGIQQDRDSLCLRPEVGWAVREQPT